MDSDKVLVPGELEKEQPPSWPTAHSRSQRASPAACPQSAWCSPLPDDTPEAALVRSVAISDALQSCVAG